MTKIQFTHDYELVTCGAKGCPEEFAMSQRTYLRTKRTGETWYCPAGHPRVWLGQTTEQKLASAEARETALRDQLHAAEADAEASRSMLIRDRARFANGVCPCCNRTFQNVLAHMKGEHPDYDPKDLKRPTYKCSCGSRFETFHGLRVHQGKVRPDNWTEPKIGHYWRHLTVTS